MGHHTNKGVKQVGQSMMQDSITIARKHVTENGNVCTVIKQHFVFVIELAHKVAMEDVETQLGCRHIVPMRSEDKAVKSPRSTIETISCDRIDNFHYLERWTLEMGGLSWPE